MTGQMSSFQILTLLPGTHGQQGVFNVPSLPRHGHRDVRRRLLPPCHQRGPHAVKVSRESTRIFRSKVQPATSTPPRRALFFEFPTLFFEFPTLFFEIQRQRVIFENSKIPFWNSNVYSSHFKHHSLKLKDYSC